MIRAAALLLAVALTLATAAVSHATVVEPPGPWCFGDFDLLRDGTVAGHMTVSLHGASGVSRSPGEMTIDDGDGPAVVTVGRTWFRSSADGREAWFEALEVEYPGPRLEAVVGRIVAVNTPGVRGFVELRNQSVTHHGEATGPLAIDEPVVQRFTVGEGNFGVWVEPAWPMIADRRFGRAPIG